MTSSRAESVPQVVIALRDLGAGGSQRSAVLLGGELAKDHHVRVVSTVTEGAPHFELPPAVQFEDLKIEPPRAWRLALLRAVVRWRRYLRRHRPDVVVCLGVRISMVVLVATLGMRLPIIVSERNDPRVQRVEAPVRLLRSALYRRAEAVVVQTQSVLGWARTRSFGPKSVAIPNAVAVSEHVADPVTSRRIVGLGRLLPQKGFDVLLRGFARVAPRFPEWGLTLGGDGPERGALEQLAAELGIADRVQFVGTVRDSQRWLADGGVFVLPSRHEGFPNTLLEAMSVGLACVAARCPSGPDEIIDPGADGLLFDVDDVDGLERHLDTVLADAGQRRQLGEQARRSVQRFSPPELAEQWRAVLQRVLAPVATVL